MAENDSVCLRILFREKEIVRDTVVETNWETGESDSEVTMVIVASVKVGKTSDVIALFYPPQLRRGSNLY